MASFPGFGMEDWIEDCLMSPTPELVKAIAEVLEPKRESVEVQLEWFEEDTMSWRDYRNTMWGNVFYDAPELERRVDALTAAGRKTPKANWRQAGCYLPAPRVRFQRIELVPLCDNALSSLL